MSEITEREVRMRCIEAASRAPNAHMQGYGKGVLQDAEAWSDWILNPKGPAAGDGKKSADDLK